MKLMTFGTKIKISDKRHLSFIYCFLHFLNWSFINEYSSDSTKKLLKIKKFIFPQIINEMIWIYKVRLLDIDELIFLTIESDPLSKMVYKKLKIYPNNSL